MLDVLGDGFTFLTATEESSWHDAALAVAAEHGVPLKVVVIPRRVRAAWMGLYGVGRDGAVLVRPDGHVAWRQQSLSAAAMRGLEKAACSVLGMGTTMPRPLSN